MRRGSKPLERTLFFLQNVHSYLRLLDVFRMMLQGGASCGPAREMVADGRWPQPHTAGKTLDLTARKPVKTSQLISRKLIARGLLRQANNNANLNEKYDGRCEWFCWSMAHIDLLMYCA